nr:uncharacterized protein LOC4343371 isoform X3 [Oryza sativa Japonica Group]
MAGVVVGSKSNRDWSDCDAAFREEAGRAIVALTEEGEQGHAHGLSLATALVGRYPWSPLARAILARCYLQRNSRQQERVQLELAAVLAPRCPHIASLLIDALISMDLFDEAAEVRDRALRVAEPTDPALHYTFVSNRYSSADHHDNPFDLEYRKAHGRETIRGQRARIEKGKGQAAASPEPASTPEWPPETVDLGIAGDRWSRMSEEERQALLKVSFGEMKSYCRSRGLMDMTSMLSDAEVFVKKGWSCPFCSGMIYVEFAAFKSHIDEEHIVGKEFLSLVPERISDSERELLRSWRWEPTDGDDLAGRTKILREVKEIVFELIDLEVVSLNLLYIMHKFIMNRVRPVAPLVVSMCGSCGIGQLSSTHLQELCELLKPLKLVVQTQRGWEHQKHHNDEQESQQDSLVVHTHRGCNHHKRRNGEQESQQDSLVGITWSQETGTLSFDCEKIASRETDGSSQADRLFACLLSEPLLEDPMELCFSMWRECFVDGPDILNNISRALGKAKLKFSSWEELKGIQGGVYFLPKAIFERDIDIKTYFDSWIGSARVEMLLIDAEVDYWKESLLKTCQVDCLAVISPIAKACLWAKLVNDPLEDALLAHPQNCHKPQVPLDAILRSLWHIRRFCGDLWEIPCISPDVKARVYRAILLRIFRSWDQCKTCDLPSSAIFMVDSLRSFVIDEKAGNISAYRVVESILERLHVAQTPLHFEFKGESLVPQTAIVPSLLGCICLAHNLFGLHIIEKKCNCVNEVPMKTKSTFFHSINLGSVEGTTLESFSELLKAVDKQSVCDFRNGGCGHRITRYLWYPPHFFMIVLRWPDNKGNHINMHKVLISLAAELDISHIYEGML